MTVNWGSEVKAVQWHAHNLQLKKKMITFWWHLLYTSCFLWPGRQLAAWSHSVTSHSQTFTLGSLSINGSAFYFLLTDRAIPCQHLYCSDVCVCMCVWDGEKNGSQFTLQGWQIWPFSARSFKAAALDSPFFAELLKFACLQPQTEEKKKIYEIKYYYYTESTLVQ